MRQLRSYCLTMARSSTNTAAAFSALESRVLDCTKLAIEKWGVSRFTVSDVCDLAEVSRATLYRMFPGGKEVLLEALHVRSLDEFFTTLLDRAAGADSLENLLVRCVVSATTELRNDQHLAMMLATEPKLRQARRLHASEYIGRPTVRGMPMRREQFAITRR